MRTAANIAIGCAIAACHGDAEPLERLPGPVAPAIASAPELPPPPAPPPPPPVPGPRSPPAVISRALRGRECVPTVTMFDLVVGEPGGRQFMGFRVRGHHAIDQARGVDLVARLRQDESYLDAGDVGCTSNRAIGIRIECAGTVLDLVEDCTHLYLTDRGHEGDWVLASDALAELIHELEN